MDRLVRPIRRHLRRARRGERFVQLLVGGGLALVAGLWMISLGRVWTLSWLLGGLLGLAGLGALGQGIRSQIEY